MLRKLALLLVPIALLAAACSSGGSDSKQPSSEPAASAVDSNGDGIYDPSRPTDVVDGTTDPQPFHGSSDATVDLPPVDVSNDTIDSPGDNSGTASVLGALSPFDLMDATSTMDSSAPADPALAQALLDASDLPAGFIELAETTRTVSNSYGDVSLTMNAFGNGDFESGEFGAMAASATMRLPQSALDEFERANGFDALANLSEDDLQALDPDAEELGIGYRDVHGLDGSGLGDGGGGLHMVIDMGALFEIFAPPGEPNPFEGGIAYDMYVFLRGNQMFMVMVMWPGDQSSGVDSRELAEALDARAADAGF